MSVIMGAPNQLQMVILNALTNSKGGGLNLKVECHPDEKDFNSNTPEVDYYAWKNNVHGEPQCTSRFYHVLSLPGGFVYWSYWLRENGILC